MTGFAQLHPALQHHVVNTLNWPALRPLQEAAIAPILGGEHAILLAPTAGGKTEAAFFPVVSRMLAEGWSGLGLLYVCPIRALLNNLEVRLQHYARLVGRRCALWHGDVGAAARRRLVADPPDCLLTTPESLEVILITRRAERAQLFAGVRVVIVDEVHAIAGDDRGWHLLAVLERITRLCGREIQRIGLSATIGDPEALLEWLAGACGGVRRVIALGSVPAAEADVTLDYVGTLDNAATVIARLHQGEKRLVFCDSRARAEDLTALLRGAGVETYVSHSALGLDERRQAEAAFTGGRDCVIVATSTLELGIDVGDLDRVIQLDAPWSVAGFLQRLGRSGRRAGSTRNCLLLATSEEALLRAAGVVRLWSEGYVEPVSPPPEPLHVFAQQIMALALQESGIGATDWCAWIGRVSAFGTIAVGDIRAVLDHMLTRGILHEDGGLLWLGRRGEERYGRRHFLELFSTFVSEPLVTVRHGRAELGQVHHVSFAVRRDEPTILRLAGRGWQVTHVDWKARVAYVEPTELEGRSRWLGAGQPLSFELCQAVRRVLAGEAPGPRLSRRALERLEAVRAGFPWIDPSATAIVRDGSDAIRWWTFGGLLANAAIAARLQTFGVRQVSADNFAIRFAEDGASASAARAVEATRATDPSTLATPIDVKTLDELKFSECLPEVLGRRLLEARMTDRSAIRAVLSAPVRMVDPSGVR